MFPSTNDNRPFQPSSISTYLARNELRLPSYEEATGQLDRSCLPSYRESRQPRYHPYARFVARPDDPAKEDRLFNTVYDDERVELDVPPARGRRGARAQIPLLVPTPLIANPIARARVEQPPRHDEALRRQYIGALILQEFVAAWPRCGARPA